MKRYLLLLSVFLFQPAVAASGAAENPATERETHSPACDTLACRNAGGDGRLPAFDKLLHKDYAANREGMDALMATVIYMEPGGAIPVLDSLERYAIRHRDKPLALEAALSKAYYCCLHDIPAGDMSEPGEYNMHRFGEILRRAVKERNLAMELQAYYWLAQCARNNLCNYELSLDYYRLMRRSLRKVTQDEFPEKVRFMLLIANSYLEFADYDRALGAYMEILDRRVTPKSENYIISAKNSIGLIYRHKEMADSSGYWFARVLESTDASRWPEWEGIASSNLGVNYLTQGDTLRAEPLLALALERALEYDDYGMAASNAVYLADISLAARRTDEAQSYLDIAGEHIGRLAGYNNKDAYFRAMGRYYMLRGDMPHAIVYHDSAYLAQKERGRKFSSSLLLRMEQKEHMQERQLSDARLRAKRSQLWVVLAGLLLVSALLVVCVRLYNKKRRAYRELVRRTQRWAGAEPALQSPDMEVRCADGNGRDAGRVKACAQNDGMAGELFARVEELFRDGHLYRDPDVTLDHVSRQLNVNRTYVSQAVNRFTGMNFSAYVNEYRVKEAIGLMTAPRSRNFSIDAIAYESGFNDRKTFYRVFKGVTGLSPSAFRHNISKQ